jgi:hypothetical protein
LPLPLLEACFADPSGSPALATAKKSSGAYTDDAETVFANIDNIVSSNDKKEVKRLHRFIAATVDAPSEPFYRAIAQGCTPPTD